MPLDSLSLARDIRLAWADAHASRMEAAGIEPASRDVSAAASTCVVAVFQLSPLGPAMRHGAVGPGRLLSRLGNRPTPNQQAR